MKLSRYAISAGAVLAVLLTAFMGVADDPIQKVVARLNQWVSEQPFEKVYLQFDKPYYAAGDDVWFKAYVTVGSENHLSGISKVLNVELVDDYDSVRKSIKLPVNAGTAWGDFILPDTLQDGNYHIRAYTNWMRNAGDDYFFNKPVTIVNAISDVVTQTTYSYDSGQLKTKLVTNYSDLNGNPYASKAVAYQLKSGTKGLLRGKALTDEKGNVTISFPNTAGETDEQLVTSIKLTDNRSITKVIPVKLNPPKASIAFFPEGGSLISGISTKVAFKAVGNNGLGVDVQGVVTNSQHRVIANFTAQHTGMGFFVMRPESGESYKVHVTFTGGTADDVTLPAVMDKGYVISVNTDDPAVVGLKITASKAQMAAEPSAVVSVVAHAGGVVCYAAKSNPGDGSLAASIPKTRFPEGIAQFTLFSSAGEPLNERLVFIRKPGRLKLNVSTAKSSFQPREKVTVNLDAKNVNDLPVVGAFSASVTDESKVPVDENDETTILSHLLLTADIRGYIEKPNYYFTDVTGKIDAALDLLMLTQGYRRFEWKQILSDVFPPITFQPEKSLQITGHIKTLGGKPIPFGKVTLFSTLGGFFIVDTVADQSGKFVFNKLVFKDSVKFVIQARTANDRKNVQIDVDNIPAKFVITQKDVPASANMDGGLSAYLHSSKDLYNEQVKYGLGNHSLLLKEVTIKAKREPVIKNSANLNGPGNADQVIKTADIVQGCSNIADCLQGRLLGVVFRNGIPYSTRSLNGAMQIIVDGVYVDTSFLTGLSPSDVESVEVLRSGTYTSIYGGRGSNGILLINTKRGEGAGTYQRYAPGIITYMPKGYYKARVFYSPQYDDPSINKSIPDLRSTIYWNPNVITDKNGTASFSYFNADGKGSYRLVIEGLDSDGNLARQVYHYKIE